MELKEGTVGMEMVMHTKSSATRAEYSSLEDHQHPPKISASLLYTGVSKSSALQVPVAVVAVLVVEVVSVADTLSL